MNLSHAELRALAMEACASKLLAHENWLIWEDYPELTEAQFDRLTEIVDELARLYLADLHVYETANNVGVDALLLRVQP